MVSARKLSLASMLPDRLPAVRELAWFQFDQIRLLFFLNFPKDIR